MNFYLVPTMSAVVIPGQPAVNVPEYYNTDLADIPWSGIPFGLDGYTLLCLASPNASLAAESDVFAFPSDLTQLLTDADVTNIADYFLNANIPSNFAVTGALWSDVLQQVAKIFLVAQALAGVTGQPIFNGTGVTLSSTVASQSQGTGKIKVGGITNPSAIATAAGGTAGVFDLSDVQDTDVVSDVLTSVSQQFTAPISIGGGSL